MSQLVLWFRCLVAAAVIMGGLIFLEGNGVSSDGVVYLFAPLAAAVAVSPIDVTRQGVKGILAALLTPALFWANSLATGTPPTWWLIAIVSALTGLVVWGMGRFTARRA